MLVCASADDRWLLACGRVGARYTILYHVILYSTLS